jgi:hypothetical protein
MARSATSEALAMAAQREWFEKDYYEVLGVAGRTAKDVTRLQEARKQY